MTDRYWTRIRGTAKYRCRPHSWLHTPQGCTRCCGCCHRADFPGKVPYRLTLREDST